MRQRPLETLHQELNWSRIAASVGFFGDPTMTTTTSMFLFSIGYMTSDHTHLGTSQSTGAARHVWKGFFWRQTGKLWSTAHTNFADTLQNTFDGWCTLGHRY